MVRIASLVGCADGDADRQGQHHLGRLGRRRLRLLRGGLGPRPDAGRRAASIEPVYKISPERKEIATEWVHVLPGANGVLFRLRHAGQGPADFEIMAMSLPHGTPHTLIRGVFARYAPTGHLLVITADGKLIAIPFDLRKLELTGPPVALRRGHRGADPTGSTSTSRSPRTARWPTPPAARSAPGRVVWVSREGGISPVDTALGPAGRDRVGLPVARREVGGRGPATGRPARHLGQAPAGRPVLPNHLRRHLQRAPGVVARQPGRHVHHGSGRRRRGIDLYPPGGWHRRPSPAAPDRAGLRPALSDARRSLAALPHGRHRRRQRRHHGAQGRRHDARPAGRHAPPRSCSRPSRRTAAGWRTARTSQARRRCTSARSPRPGRPSGRCPPPAEASRPGLRAAASCSTSTARARWSPRRSRRAPRSASGGSEPCSRSASCIGRVRFRCTP